MGCMCPNTATCFASSWGSVRTTRVCDQWTRASYCHVVAHQHRPCSRSVFTVRPCLWPVFISRKYSHTKKVVHYFFQHLLTGASLSMLPVNMPLDHGLCSETGRKTLHWPAIGWTLPDSWTRLVCTNRKERFEHCWNWNVNGWLMWLITDTQHYHVTSKE